MTTCLHGGLPCVSCDELVTEKACDPCLNQWIPKQLCQYDL